MLRIFGDFETYYDRGYSLRRLSPIEYILNPQWETLACAIAIEHEPAFLLPRDEVADFLRDINQPYCFISHNALFDACVLAYRYNIHPHALLCTLSISRAVLYHEIPNGKLSLKNVLKHLNLAEKTDFILQMAGKHWSDLENDPGLMMGFTGYALNDCEGCRDIFFRLHNQFPAQEALFLDRVIKMATRPRLCLDVVALDDYRRKVVRRKQELMEAVGKTGNPCSALGNLDPGKLMRINNVQGLKPVLMSNAQFAELLQDMGVDPPVKISPTTGKKTWAFAKTDQGLIDLLEYDDPDVQAVVAARLGVKTTIEETRASRLISIGLCTFQTFGKELLPVPLKFSGAHTHRLSGDWLLNLQNLSARTNKEIRKGIVAPPGYTIVEVDAAQIEARLVAWLSKCSKLLNQYHKGEDTYKNFAATIFGTITLRVTKAQRFVAKTCILGLGFGMSDVKLYRTITTLAREQGIDIEITPVNCAHWVDLYRSEFYAIPRAWRDLEWVINEMASGRSGAEKEITFGPCAVEDTTIMLPSGLRLYYDNLRFEYGEYCYNSGQFTKKVYGAKMFENIVQALDRQQVMEAGVRTEFRARKLGIQDPRVLLNLHDANVYCVPDDEAQSLAELALEDMRTPPSWGPDLPLAAEVKIGKNYGEMEPWQS